MADWLKIKTEYITTDTSYRKLAEKYGVSRVQIGSVGKEEGWVELKRQHLAETMTQTLAADAKEKADMWARINNASAHLLDKIERAITELDIQLYKHTEKTKTIEYNNPERADKPTKEVIHEDEKLLEVSSIIDRAGLKQIASALRDIKEVQDIRSELDRREQEARIANLEKQANKDDNATEPIRVVIAGELEEYSE